MTISLTPVIFKRKNEEIKLILDAMKWCKSEQLKNKKWEGQERGPPNIQRKVNDVGQCPKTTQLKYIILL